MTAAEMTRRDREDLAKVARMRARVAKDGIVEQAAVLLADVERQLSAIYSPGDEAWSDLTSAANEAVLQADAELAKRCKERGIPAEFRPRVSFNWYGRGSNAMASRRTELRAAAKAQIDAQAKRAKTAIDAKTAEVCTELIAGGLSGDEARKFLATIPSAAELMPAITVAEIEARTGPNAVALKLEELGL